MSKSFNFSLALSLSLLGACADKPDDNLPSSEEIASSLEQENGGFDTADEKAEFGASAMFAAAQIEADVAVTDTMASDPALSTMERDTPAFDRHRVLVMWGKVPPQRDATEVRDWTGSLAISRGGLRVSRAIAFEDRTDHLEPRTDAASVSFASLTKPAADGLALGIFDPTPDAADPLTLTYTNAAGDVSLPIDLGALDEGPVRIDAGNGFELVALGARDADGCKGGFMRGRWHSVDDTHGVYLGLVVNRLGEVVGHVRGLYGEKPTGEHVMFGKFIDRDGHFMGILRGTYGEGHYEARWIDRAGEHGRLGGRIFDGPVADDGRGGFAGRWAETGCAED